MDNDNFHIKSYTVEKLQIIYLYETKTWKDRISDDVVIPDNFPYYKTLFENDGWIEKELLALTASEVNLLADLTSYNLEHILKEPFLHLFE
jgi:heat shock protein HspQ